MTPLAGVERRRLVAAIVFGALASGCGVALMGTSGWLLSRAAEQPPVLYLMVAIVSVRAFGLGKGVFRYVERLVGHDLALRLQATLRLDTYRALVRSTWVGRRSGDLLSRVVSDVEGVQDLVVRAIVPIASIGLVTVATGTVLTVMSPAAGAVIVLSAVLAGVLVPWVVHRLAASAAATLAPLRGELAAVTSETAEAAADLVAYGAAPRALRDLADVDDRLRRAEARVAWSGGVGSAAQVLSAAVALIGALLIGGREVVAGTLPAVQLAVLVLTPLALHEVLGSLPAAAISLSRSRTALARVREIQDAPVVGTPDRAELGSDDLAAEAGSDSSRVVPPGVDGSGRALLGTRWSDWANLTSPGPRATASGMDQSGSFVSDGPAAPAAAVVIRGLSAGWPASDPVVVGLDLTVAPGERVALTGPSGSGKTTIAATIMALLPPRAGSVSVTGSIGYLAQDAYLFDTSVAENVRIGDRDATDKQVEAALRAARLDLPLDRLVGLHGNQISGGEARRVALARLLLRPHPVLILDEPTEHLDPPTAAALLADLWRLSSDAAVLVITHDRELAGSCDRSVALVADRVAH
jgi:ATP-binding cassette, subfamily C, bacterial CydC